MAEREFTFEELRAHAKKVAENSKNNRSNYSEAESAFQIPEWLGLEDKTFTVIRPVGPIMEKRKEPWQAKFVVHSRIVNDQGWKMDIFWPHHLDEFNMPKTGFDLLDKNFLFMKAYKAIAKGCKDTKDAYPKTGDFADTDIFKRIMWNKTAMEQEWDSASAKKKGLIIKSPFIGKSRVVIPVWDESDEWCQENNSSKLLTSKKKVSEVKDKKYDNSDIGIPYNLYQSIQEKIAAENGGSWDTDFLIHREGSATQRGQEPYSLGRLTDSVEVKKVLAKTGRSVSVSPLGTDFHNSLNHKDLDKHFALKYYNFYYNFYLDLFKGVDVVAKQNLTEELTHLKEEESKEWAKTKAEETKTVSPVSKPESMNEPAKPAEAPAKIPVRAPIKKEKVWTKEEVSAKCEEIYPHWSLLTDEDREMTVSGIKGFNPDNSVILEDHIKDLEYYTTANKDIDKDCFDVCPTCNTITWYSATRCHGCETLFREP